MERCLTKNPDINVVYTINEPAAVGAHEGAEGGRQRQGRPRRLGRRRLRRRRSRSRTASIDATSQQYPLKMAELGVKAIEQIATGGEKPEVTAGLDFFDTGVALVTDKPADGVESIDSTEGAKLLGTADRPADRGVDPGAACWPPHDDRRQDRVRLRTQPPSTGNRAVRAAATLTGAAGPAPAALATRRSARSSCCVISSSSSASLNAALRHAQLAVADGAAGRRRSARWRSVRR